MQILNFASTQSSEMCSLDLYAKCQDFCKKRFILKKIIIENPPVHFNHRLSSEKTRAIHELPLPTSINRKKGQIIKNRCAIIGETEAVSTL